MSNTTENKIHFFHPDLLHASRDETREYFKNHKASKSYRDGFPDLDENETEIYLYVKEVLLNTLEKILGYIQKNADNIKNISYTKEDIDKFFDCFKQLHIIEDNFLSHLELSMILWLHNKEYGADISKLQKVLDDKLLPKTDPKDSKLKISAFIKSLSANLAVFIENKGISKRQSVLLSSEFFNLSHSTINELMPDVQEAHKNGYLETLIPAKQIILAFIYINLKEHTARIQNIVNGYQKKQINRSRLKHFNETYEAFIELANESSQYFISQLNDSEIEYLNKLVASDPNTKISNIKIEENDDLESILAKLCLVSASWIVKLFAPQTIKKAIPPPE